jgi:hypothetical protein
LSAIEDLLNGSIDMHIHFGPDPRVGRRVDALQVARYARDAGMRAVVLKSHEYPTAPVAYVVNQVVSDITVFGSVCLDFEVGGLNTYALEASAKVGAKVVWMPTFTSANDVKLNTGHDGGISVLDSKGKLLPVIDELLNTVKKYEMVLCTGHISTVETFALVDRALEKGISRIIITHPLWPAGGNKMGLADQQKLAKKGAFIEHCFGNTMPFPDRVDPLKFAEAMKAVGAEHCVMTTDLGQEHNPAPAEGMRVAIGTMLKCGLSEREVEFMVKINPAALLGLS